MKRIALWGTGNIAGELINENYFIKCEIVAFIDNNKSATSLIPAVSVYTPIEFIKSGLEYDYIVVVTIHSSEIYNQCIELNLDLRKVVFVINNITNYENKIVNNYQCDIDILSISEKLYNDFQNRKYYEKEKKLINICGYDSIDKNSKLVSSKRFAGYNDDYARYRGFELAAYEIITREIPGDAAEIGVYQGTFAALINETFHNKKLYLFDTFESFDKDEYDDEFNKGNCPENFYNIFLDTSCDLVMSKMAYPDNCIIKKGLFPESATGLEDIILSFVSIDVDFEKSVYESLKWIYPKLSSGGYIFLHDYNNFCCGGVKTAVTRYEQEFGRLHIVPITDSGGTLVITK